MYSTIIVGWDASEGARDALALAATLRAPDGTVIAACIYDDEASGSPAAEDAERQPDDVATAERAHELLAEAGPDAAWLGTVAVAAASATDGLGALVTQRDASLLVIGSSRHARPGRVHTGCVGRSVLRHPPCAVALPPKSFHHHARAPRRVGVAFDGSHQLSAVPEAAALASSLSAGLHLLCVVPPLATWARSAGEFAGYEWDVIASQYHDHFRQLLDQALADLDDAPATARLVEDQPLSKVLADEAHGLDLLVLGVPASGALRRIFAGDTTGAVLSATCPVLMIADQPVATGAGTVGDGEPIRA
jgi:nucleotide-binding universal stress UspA family protein